MFKDVHRLLPVLFAISCGTLSSLDDPVRKPVGVSVFAPDGSKALVVPVGGTVKIITFIKYAEGDSSSSIYAQFWASQDTSIAKGVGGAGDILGVKAGSTVLNVVIADKFLATMPVTVR
ncbi:MAG: hypothetical protein ABJE47_18985 [bacterium]